MAEANKNNSTGNIGTGVTPGGSTTGANVGGSTFVPPVNENGSTNTTANVNTAPPKEEMVSVPKSLIDQILKKQEELEKSREEDKAKIDMLTYAADKNRIGIYESRNAKGELIRTYNVGFWNISDVEKGEKKSYIVRGTKLVFQDVAIEDNGGVRRLIEKQTLRVFLDQGPDQPFKEIDVPYVYFYQTVERKRFPSVKESTTNDGVFRTIRFDDGREIEFDINFLNY